MTTYQNLLNYKHFISKKKNGHAINCDALTALKLIIKLIDQFSLVVSWQLYHYKFVCEDGRFLTAKAFFKKIHIF